MSRIRAVLCGWWVWALAIGVAHAGLPETPQPRQLGVADGLPANRINDIAEDANGYLWIATSDGLARYDGIGFEVWRVGRGLRDNFVWSVHVDARNRVWVGTAKAGLAMLDADRRAFRYYDRRNHPRIGSNDIWSIASTRDGALWFGTADGGLHRMAADGAITRYMPRPGDPRSLPSAGVSHLSVAKDGTLWIATKDGGVARWTGRDFEVLPASALHAPVVNGITVEPDGSLWIGTPRGLSLRRPDGSADLTPWASAPQRPMLYHMLLRDSSGLRWLDTIDGLGRDDEGAVRNVPLYSDTAHGLVKPSWSGAYEDRAGGLWFASTDSGLWYLPANWRQFSVLPRLDSDPGSPANAYVHGIAPAASGDMWLVGSGGVLDLLDPETGRIDHRLRDAGAGYMPMSVREDHAGRVWIGYYNGLARFDPQTGAVRRWDIDGADPALPREPTRIVEASDGALWIATDAALQVRDGEGRVLDAIVADGRRGLGDGATLALLDTAPDGGIWVAGSQGLLAWNAGARRLEPVPGAPARETFGFAWDAAHHDVWLAHFGTLEAYAWDGARLRLRQRLDARQGLPAIAVNGLTVDSDGVVWMTSVRGLIRVDPATGSSRVYGMRDGLPNQEFGGPPVPRPQDGRILAGSPDGLVIFDPAVVRPPTAAPQLVVESIGARRGEEHVAFRYGRPFTLHHDDRDLRIVARLLSFNDASTHRYRFRLRGYDADWVEVGASGERVFSQLAPGRYRLDVMARTADNAWSPVRTIAFGVEPPWWRTPGALAGFLGLAALLLWAAADAYRARLRQRHEWQLAEHKRELAEQASLAKTRFLATLGHEVRTPMTGVLGMSELLLDTSLDARQRGYTEAIRGAGNHLLRLVDDALDLARIESGKLELDPQPFVVRALVAEVVALMAPLAHRRGLRFVEDVAPDVPAALHGDALRIKQVLLNLLGNAIKFTERGEVGLRVRALAPQGACFEVSDTGPGLDAGQQARLFRRFEQAEGSRTAARYGGSGLGLAISQELAAAMGGRIALDSSLGAGARFRVELPLPAAAAPDAVAVAAASRGTRALELLLVEDDAIVADVVTGLLQAQGHRVVHAAHGLAALGEVAGQRFDLALLDLDLPGLDGLALARQLRALGFAPPLLAVTARADAEVEALARAAGFDGFLRKPLTGAMLAGAIEALLPERAHGDATMDADAAVRRA